MAAAGGDSKRLDVDNDDDEGKMVDLVSQEGDNFQVKKKVARMSELVKTMTCEDDDEEEQQEIPLPNVKSQILAKVMEFCKHYSEESMNDIRETVEKREYERGGARVVRELCGCGAGGHLRAHPRRELYGHKTALGFDVRSRCVND